MHQPLQKLIPLCLISIVFSQPTLGRWASKEDEGSSVLKHYITYKIKADGTYTRRAEEEIEIVREDARMTEGLIRFKYKPDSETFRLVEAYTINGSRKENVPVESIEDKPLASSGEGFDVTSQLTIVFPDVKVGSKVHYVTEREYKTVQVPGFFSEYLFFGGEYFKDIQVEIDSELPLFVQLVDPTRGFKLKTSKNSLRLKSRTPIHRRVVDEIDAILNPDTHPWMIVTTSDKWTDFAKSIILEHEKILSEPLPDLFKHILKEAKAAHRPEEQMNIITSQIANHLRYHGDWRSVRGRNIPRSLALVAKTRFGDCKDFAAITTVLLRLVGIPADMAWVSRSIEPDFTPTKYPHVFFNHAIVRAEINGKVYWVDPTNTASFAQGIFEDIIDRPAFILSSSNARIEEIPAGTPSTSGIDEYQEISFGAQPHVIGKVKFLGREASFEAGLAKEASNESIRHHFIDFISRDLPISSWQLSSLDLSDRVTRDFEIPFEFSPKINAILTSAGTGFKIPTPRRIAGLFEVRTDRVSDYFVAQPITLVSEMKLKNVQIVGNETLNCRLETPWLTAARSFSKTSNEAIILDRVEILKSTITPHEIGSREFVDFQQKLIACFRSNILIFKQK